MELAKALSVEDKNAIKAYIETYKRKSAEEVLKNNPQLAPKQAGPDQTALLAEKDREIEQLRDENAAKHNQYLELFSQYTEARKKLVEYAESRANAAPAPASTTARSSNTAPAAAAVVDSGEYLVYTVQSGDYPSKIAGKYGVNVRKIMELNGLTEEAAKRIKVGQKLKIPKK
ncbi:MAG: LysM peptidoglycan-binding domain-containing protein [Lentisphaerae bacterium]|nr:LysM peptidoglycan-binding domain-containing protein [Lentisphaerota bacterium]